MKKEKKLDSAYTIAILGSVLLIFSSFNIVPEKNKKFLSEIGVCTGIENASMLAEKGYSYIEGGVGSTLSPDMPDDEYQEKLKKIMSAELPVKSCNSFIPGRLKSVGPDAVHTEILKYVETAFQRAEKIGIEYIVFGSSGSRSIPEGFSREEARNQFISLCKEMGPLAAKYNVVVVIEPLNTKEVNFINSVSEGGEIVKDVNHPNIRLLADIYHMMMENEGPESILEYGKLIKHIHIAEKQDRAAPGTNNEDFTPYFAALKKIDYKGRISIECRWKDITAQSGKAIQVIQEQRLTKIKI